METKYTVDYFIEKFKKIPHIKWYVGSYYNKEKTKFCVLGHCGASFGGDHTDEYESLIDIFMIGLRVARINDGENSNYQQKTPRARVLAALRDIKKRNNSQTA